MKVLVTGHQGFIGSKVFHRLTEDGHDVQGVDLKDHVDYADTTSRPIDAIVHCAALIDGREAEREPVKYFEENVMKLLRYATELECQPRFIFLSSAAVYGDLVDLHGDSFSEELVHIQRRPPMVYGMTKLIGEWLVRRTFKSHVILRLANVYDPDGKGGQGALWHFMNDDPIKVHNPRIIRDFVHVGTVVEAISRALKTDGAKTGKITGTFNIGTGIPTTIGSAATLIGDMRGVKVRLDESTTEPEVAASVLDPTIAHIEGFLDY